MFKIYKHTCQATNSETVPFKCEGGIKDHRIMLIKKVSGHGEGDTDYERKADRGNKEF